jgi:CubicO group peptidase (beta-lactamase class C family)
MRSSITFKALGLLSIIVLPGCQTVRHEAASNPSTSPKSLGIATDGQDERFGTAFDEINSWVEQKAFPGAVVAVGINGKLVALKSFGKISSEAGSPPMPVDAIFDLASVSKVAGTTTAAALLYDRGLLDLEKRVIEYIPEFAGTPGHDVITVRDLLLHSTGLFTPDLLWKTARNREELLRLIYKMPLAWQPGAKFQYRDENMILMAEIAERITGKPLDRFLAEQAFGPLGMKDTGYNPPASDIARIPPTEQDDLFRHTLVRGVVHDENAYIMGGIAGHAGLFASARDLSQLAQMYLDRGLHDGRRILQENTVDVFMARQEIPPGTSRALGWDTPGEFSAFAGPLAAPDAIVHTGFTGTSMYIDRSRRTFIILLTNRVNPTRQNTKIAQARIAIHTALLFAIDNPTRSQIAVKRHRSD